MYTVRFTVYSCLMTQFFLLTLRVGMIWTAASVLFAVLWILAFGQVNTQTGE